MGRQGKRNPLPAGLILLVLCTVSTVNSYSKYGRGCNDIGCMPNEICILQQDSCGFGQRDGKDCGSYPTCKRNPNGGSIKPSDDDHPSPSSPSSSHNLHSNSVPDSHTGGGNTNSGGFSGFSAGGHGLYPELPNSNNGPAHPNPPPTGGYGGYAPPSNGGYMPPANGGYQPPYGGYNPNGYNNGGQGGYNPNGYNSGGQGGYHPAPAPAPSKPKDDKGGFFSNFLSSPAVNQAISGIISGQITKALQGGGSQPQQPQYNPSGGYGNGGGSHGASGSSFVESFLGSVLSGGGSNGGGGNKGLGESILGSVLSGGGGASGNSGNSGNRGGISDFFSSKNFGGLFNENSKSSQAQPPSNGPKGYPTQPPPYGRK